MEVDDSEVNELSFNYKKRRQKRIWNCTKCSDSFDTSRKLRTHRKIHRKQEDDVQYNYRHDRNRNVYVCYTCDLELDNKEEMEKHVLDHEEKHTCKICDETFVKPYEYSCHVYNHDPSKGFGCPFCKYTTKRRTAVMIHINTFHLRKFIYSCDLCGKGFNDCVLFKEHHNVHEGIRPFRCVVCNKDFVFSSYLTSHQIRYHKVSIDGMLGTNQCCLCLKSFKRQSTLEKHMEKHNNQQKKIHEKRYLCDICGKGFAQTEKLRIHYRVHTGIKPYVCSYCTKSFTKRDYLIMHERVHSGEKPYSCEYCGKCFNQGAPLRLHIRSHTGERPYLCHLCNTGYISRSVLNLHLKSCPGTGESRHSQHKKNADLYSKYKTKFGLKPCAVYLDNLALTKDTLSKLNLKQLTIIPLKILPLSKESLNVFGKLYQKPTFSCTQCLEKFDDNIKLKRHSMVHKMKPNKLAKKQSYKCYICLKKFSDRNILWGHMRNHSGKSGELKCPHCQKTFKEQKIFSAHKTVCSKSSEVVEKSTWIMNAPVLKYRCCICMKRFADVLAMREHKKHHSNSKESDLENEETVSVNEEWQFKCCQQIFPNLNFLCLHMYQSFLEDENLSCSPQYVCSVCGTTFSGGLEWKQHNKKIHDLNFDYGLETKIKYVCSACGMKYDDVVKLLFHRLLVCKTSSLIELYESVSFAKVTTEKTNNCVMPVVTESTPNQINISVNLQPTNPQQSLVTIILNSTEHLKPYENTPASASSNLRICTSPKDIKVESVQTKEKAIDVSESEDEISDMSKPRIFVRNLEELMAPSETKTSEPMLCKDCGKCFRNLYTYRMHTNISLKKNTCKLCSYQTCVFPNLRKHYAEVHHASYLCFRCKKFFTTVEDCREHKCDVEGFGSVPYFSGSLFQDRND